jgi:two-component system alkaline phosphatase synthesis response regulator PhoP
MENKKFTILLVDDEPDIIDFLSYNLKKEGFKVVTANNGIEALKITKQISPNLILLDVMMPKMDGIETCRLIREDISINQPIIAFLTSRSEDYSQIAGFEAGADDYISKPIRPRLMVSKVISLLRRDINSPRESMVAPTQSVKIDRERFLILVKGEEISLPKKEFELLELLVSKPGKVYNREQILSLIWGNDTIVGERTIDVHIRKLREKLGDAYIRTIKGVGYTFQDV